MSARAMCNNADRALTLPARGGDFVLARVVVPEPWMEPVRRRALLKGLARWSQTHGRMLPWRACGDPYKVWLSEIMLQQTTVVAVVPYFERFLARFPTLADLAAADENEVLRLWEGLGYYSRARNLYAAARQLVAEHQGTFPDDVATLQSLPGVGRYTAGAIASFAFDRPAPIVEANTQRLYARLLGEDRPLQTAAAQRALWGLATELVSSGTPTFGPAAINQALMDLGAKVCTPTDPACPACPLQAGCVARATQREREIPKPAVRPAITPLEDVTIAVDQRGAYLLRRRPVDERWAGLWDFPRFTLTESASVSSTLADGVLAQTGLQIAVGAELASFQHSVTRYRIQLRCFVGTVIGGTLRSSEDLAWVSPREFDTHPLSVTGRKFARLLQSRPDV